ncbi:MAG: UDP-N-acetylmuramoyl-tripeptide--D-alanyl-D-alanine ligase [Candidatus Omnitrophica bacterium]|nr:UDP-N-acetylmuramoyl-tripeptide--D-alanyl-D-alanine ligase [Candidatus Omnitrophota bacterium]MBU4473586.1 UDP-N-acetylmuramoyl-tripeptide--D-alanyl-D-alanine ligase [Candidatus Omnitrophota bacterium]MCG2706303.1 UDP-N-acetylmuramoyl-tripeptide--D-alanyl-D-alanine ligase [Candidatus Omnitrophota bacterium]
MFKVDELLEATGGKLIQGRGDIIARGISIDSRTIKPQEAFIAIKGVNLDGHGFIAEAIKKRAACIIASCQQGALQKQKNVTFIEAQDTIKALGDIAGYQRRKFNIPVIAISGSNGKTTTKEMIAWILSKKFNVLKNEGTKNNHIGLPLALLNLRPEHDIAVLELGTNHFGEIDYLGAICQPNIGIITNIGPVHLEYFHNLEGVFREKYRLIENLKKPYIAILNADSGPLRKQTARKIKKPIIFGFAIKHKCDFSATDIKIFNTKIEFLAGLKYRFTLKTLGYYNIYNALAAVAVARIFGIEYKDIKSRLVTFNFPQGRLKVIKLNKVRFIDDTYNSNPVSLGQALNTLNNFRTKGKKILVMGDMLELGNYKKLFHCQAGRRAAGVCDALITVGKLSKMAAQTAQSCGLDVKNIFICDSVQEAANILFNKIVPEEDDIVLVKGSRLMRMEEVFRG